MLRLVAYMLVLSSLTGCLCLPEQGESVDTNYFSSCWDTAQKGPRNQVLFPKP